MWILSRWWTAPRQWFTREDTVSGAWLDAHAATETKVGWEGPRWRTPAERLQMARQDRRRREAR